MGIVYSDHLSEFFDAILVKALLPWVSEQSMDHSNVSQDIAIHQNQSQCYNQSHDVLLAYRCSKTLTLFK